MRRRRRIAALTAAMAAMALPASASAEVLFDQIDQTSPQSINSQDFPTANDQFDAVNADDFVVPPGETWTLDSALVRGTSSGSGAATSARVFVFADAGGKPGAQLFAGVASATAYPRMVLSFAGPTLPAGTYWFGAQAILDPGTSAPFNQWFWAENSERAGALAVYRNPGDGFNTGCTAFTIKSECPFGSEVHLAPDQSFSLSGTRTVAPPPGDPACDAAKSKLAKAKVKLRKAKAKLADAEGRAKDRAKDKVKKAKARVRAAKAAVAAEC